MASFQTILVTNGSTFIGSHCILQALQKGHHVRTTVRSPRRRDEVRDMLRTAGASRGQIEALEFFHADALSRSDDLEEAVNGCTAVLHSIDWAPAISLDCSTEDLVSVARDTTLEYLEAARASGTVRRVVVTNSATAIMDGHRIPPKGRTFTEEDWAELEKPAADVSPVARAATIAERAIWKWRDERGGSVQVTIIDPVAKFGPILHETQLANARSLRAMLTGEMTETIDLRFCVVDIRDLADLNLRVLSSSTAANERYIASADSESINWKSVAKIVKAGLSAEDQAKIKMSILSGGVLKAVKWSGILMGMPSDIKVPKNLGKSWTASNKKAKVELGWNPRPVEETLIAAAASMKEFGLDIKQEK